MKRYAVIGWSAAPAPSPRRRQPLGVEPLEERWLLDGQVALGPLGGGGLNDIDLIGLQRTPISVISLGTALAAALLYGPPGCPGAGGGGGRAPGSFTPGARVLAGPQVPDAGLPALPPVLFQAEAAWAQAAAAQAAAATDDLAQSLTANPFRLDLTAV